MEQNMLNNLEPELAGKLAPCDDTTVTKADDEQVQHLSNKIIFEHLELYRGLSKC